jgi:hypothetical protein
MTIETEIFNKLELHYFSEEDETHKWTLLSEIVNTNLRKIVSTKGTSFPNKKLKPEAYDGGVAGIYTLLVVQKVR